MNKHHQKEEDAKGRQMLNKAPIFTNKDNQRKHMKQQRGNERNDADTIRGG